MSMKEVKKLIKKLPDVELDEKDIQSVCLQILYEINGDTAAHSRVKIEALRLLADITLKKKSEEVKEYEKESFEL